MMSTHKSEESKQATVVVRERRRRWVGRQAGNRVMASLRVDRQRLRVQAGHTKGAYDPGSAHAQLSEP